MSNNEQASSDPLPYTQVDRAVKPKATLLASLMGTTTQHALGSLVEFWDLNGDPREIEKLMAVGKHEVVLSRDVAKLRFRLASAHDVEPENLEALGLLETVEGGFRVRGMSRYFAPIEGRMSKRAAAKAGGEASVKARREKYGTAQPRSAEVREQFEPLQKQPGTSAEADSEPAPKQTPNQSRSEIEPQRTADSVQLLKETLSSELDDPPPASFAVVFGHWQAVMGKPDAKPIAKRRRAVAARIREGYTVEQLKKAVDGCARTPHNMGQNEQNQRYDDLELICRDGAHVERFMHNAASPTQTESRSF